MKKKRAIGAQLSTMIDRTYALDELPTLEEELKQPIGQEELERRRKLVERTLKLREDIGPINFDIARAIRAMREGEEIDDDG